VKLIFEVKERIAYITINRPEVMNAMDPEVYSLLSEAWVNVRDDPEGLHRRSGPEDHHSQGA
jgi:enoyl-CoA hydratase/carnithine racemase